jgi:hypothetical protein
MNRRLLFALLLPCAVFAADTDKPKDTQPKSEPAAAKDTAAKDAAAKPLEEVPHAVPLKFVPAKKGQGRGASGTDLSRKSFDPTALVAMIDIGLDESFPVVDEKGVTRFTVKMTEGDDKHLVLEVSTKDGSQKVGLVRDDPTEVTVAGTKYELRFPTTQVNSNAKTTTDQAMIFVTQRP